MKKAKDNKLFIILLILAVLLTLNLILPRVENPRPAFAAGGMGSIACSADGRYVYVMDSGGSLYRSEDYGNYATFQIAKQ